ncbi:tyrosine recombinase XerD [Paenibacillus dendritiformis]|uniref:tyrosine-type recombinase/integrase n=1 Tax=Paenibacillus TaxID=44249 RepID=UPI001B1119AE|nr:tyrosine-type recombinase/integrase [Paenibacillus dendritiformis]GIO81725.1 tyrosine recombinase XerD [Paenibacillus dendritiformis]
MEKNTSQKVVQLPNVADDSLSIWKERFMEEKIIGNRSRDVEKKIDRQLQRFIDFFRDRYGHERVSAITKRDVEAWMDKLYPKDPDAPHPFDASTVNNHKAHLSTFMGWVQGKVRHMIPEDPTKGVKEIKLPAPEARSLSDEQIISLINVCDRLERFHQLKGRRWKGKQAPLKKNARPKRDRAIVFMLLDTGIRREMIVNLNLDQLDPNEPDKLRKSRKAKLLNVQGKGMTLVNKSLSSDLRKALADYIEYERVRDTDENSKALFLTALSIPERRPGGRMHVRSINRILQKIGEWHDAEQNDPERKISPLHPHSLRHTYAFDLSRRTQGNPFVLQEELGHRNERYISTYTRNPEKSRYGGVLDNNDD